MKASTPTDLVQIQADAASMLLSAQRAIDDALELACLIVAEADGKTRAADPARVVAIARGLVASPDVVRLASYLTDDAMRDGEPTRAALLRSISEIFLPPAENRDSVLSSDNEQEPQ